jgi:hypothetical protein
MSLKPLDPVVQKDLGAGWSMNALESGRSPGGITAHLVLMNGTPRHAKTLALGDEAAQHALVEVYATHTGLAARDLLKTLLQFILTIESATRLRDAKKPTAPKEHTYDEDEEGLWLVQETPQGQSRQQLANFSATITTDIVEDDGTPETRRFFEVMARYEQTYAQVRVAAKDFHGMAWVAETLGAKAHIIPGAYQKEHTAAAIQDLSDAIEMHHTYVHTGWRRFGGIWHYLHGAGAIWAEGTTTAIAVSLADTLARYCLPAPPTAQARTDALKASLALRDVAPRQAMIPIVGMVYLAPLRTLLAGAPPDLTTWIVGPSGQFKSEYAALALAHFGDFTRLTLPASFVATGNALERLCHALQDSLLVVDDFYPAGDRKHAEAMNNTADRLLRGIGNQAGRQRMRHDTSLRSDLPPRCLVLATGERLPAGHSTQARTFLVTVPKVQDNDRQAWADALSAAQDTRGQLPAAMAAYLQCIAAQWDTLAALVPQRFHALRAAVAHEEGHAREPGQVAYLELGWDMFLRCAVDAGALTAEEAEACRTQVHTALCELTEEHSQILHAETTVNRFLTLLMDGLASKQIYLRALDDNAPPRPTQWGWTEEWHYDREADTKVPVAEQKQAMLVGYVDEDFLYLLPEAIYRYLQQASQRAGRTWPVDATTLLRELDDAHMIRTDTKGEKQIHRLVLKKIRGKVVRCLWLKRPALTAWLGECPDDPEQGDNGTPQGDDEEERLPF